MTTISDEDMEALREKELANALAKVNAGGTLTRYERSLIEEANARSKTVTTELGFEVPVGEKAWETLEAEGRWPDLTRLKARRPEVLAVAVQLLGYGTPVRTVCDLCRLSPCTVQAIKDDPVLGQSVVSQKAEVLSQVKLAFRLSIEAHVEAARKGELDMLGTKMLFEMMQVLDGGATSRTEHVVTIRSEADEALWRLVQDSRQQGAPVMHLSGGNLGAVGALEAEVLEDRALVSDAQDKPLISNGLGRPETDIVSNDAVPVEVLPGGGGGLGSVQT